MPVRKAGRSGILVNPGQPDREIVDRPGWESGNGLVLIVMGSGYRQADTYDGDRQKAPLL